ncbi:MAG: sulfite exporter TauE/SafE family protein [Nitrosomonadaceae bacterium]
MWSAEVLAVVVATFVPAGFVKGVIGLGLPTVSLALLTATLGLKEAMALMLIPSFVTNVWQGLAGDFLGAIIRRLWTLLVAVCVSTWFGASLLAQTNTAWLSALLGITLCVYSTVSLSTSQIPSPGRWEKWLSPTVGILSGLLTGLTGTFVVPGVLYLQALDLSRDALVQAMGVLFTISTLALAVALQGHKLLSVELGMLSAAALIPACFGMVVGQWVRHRLTEQRFRKIFFISMLVLGLYIVTRSLLLL